MSDEQLAAARTRARPRRHRSGAGQSTDGVRVSGAGRTQAGLLGQHADNPALGAVLVDGVDATTETALVVAPATDIPLEVAFADTDDVNWLTSCGTMHDFDLATAYLRVEPEDPQSGTFGIVVRDTAGRRRVAVLADQRSVNRQRARTQRGDTASDQLVVTAILGGRGTDRADRGVQRVEWRR